MPGKIYGALVHMRQGEQLTLFESIVSSTLSGHIRVPFDENQAINSPIMLHPHDPYYKVCRTDGAREIST